MRVLIVGSGGREHTLAWKIRQSSRVGKVFVAPGNPGMESLAERAPIAVDDLQGLLDFVQRQQIDLTVVGPEYPLSLGLVDRLKAAGRMVVGPTQAAAQLESSKSFSKEIMERACAPTARAEVLSLAQLRARANSLTLPIVLKADGLAAGKGVFVCHSAAELAHAVGSLADELHADTIVAEQFLIGREASLIVAARGESFVTLEPAHDYKRIGEGDTGLNTGGMGTVSPTPHLTDQQKDRALETIVRPVLREMMRRGTPFSGFLYAGLMIGPDGELNCLEFNARLGDPETQVILRRMKSDIVPLLEWLAGDESAEEPVIDWDARAAVCVVLASHGYPEHARKGDRIEGLNLAAGIPDVTIFHSGTERGSDGALCTAGGRVLNVTACGETIEDARSKAYRAADMIQFPGMQLRRDIGARRGGA